MKHVNQPWEIRELIARKNEVNPRPQYQRAPVWTIERKSFLIDSILRGYDLPKFYVRAFPNHDDYRFDVADGQQRMRAIWDFHEGKFSLQKNTIIDGRDLSELHYNELPEHFKKVFLDYTLAFTEVLDCQVGEINELFKRLQKGVSLNPPELRHAMYSEIGFYINSFLEKRSVKAFFDDSRIVDNRFKHQEYVDHAITLIHFKNKKDLKANLMSQLYIDFENSPVASFKSYFIKGEKVFQKLADINSFKKGIFKNKWAFVDYFWLLYRNLPKLPTIDVEQFAQLATEFEAERVKYNSKPEKLLKLKRVKFGDKLYRYIQAFNKEGAKKENINIRAMVLDHVFNSFFK